MHRAILKTTAAGCAALLVAACASVPAGPSLQALPGSRQSLDQFGLDDGQCRSMATDRLGGTTPSGAANQSAAASVVAGTAVGAAAGALVDGSSGAAAGAGMGLLFGALAGTSTSQGAYAVTQQQFDTLYYACMYARGHKVPVPANDVARYRSVYESVSSPATRPVSSAPADVPPADYRPPSAPPPR
jgi:hypothetical protein